MQPPMINERHYDERIDLTGRIVVGCYFDGCILEANVAAPGCLVNSAIKDCRLIGNGWPHDVRNHSR